MATVKTLVGNIKGPKGDNGEKGNTGEKGATGDTGTRGSRWTEGTAITGTSTTATVFSGTGISDSLVNDVYLNTSTGNVYRCTLAGNADTAKWVYAGNIKGPTGAQGAKGDTGATGPAGPKGNPSTVNGKAADSSGNINITAENVGALPLAGGRMNMGASLSIGYEDGYESNDTEYRSKLDEMYLYFEDTDSNNAWYSYEGIRTNYDWFTIGLGYNTKNTFEFISSSFNTWESADLGTSSRKWANIYATNGTIQTSDRNEKNTIADMTKEQAEALIYGLKPSTYHMNAGTSGRTHWGMISQDIEELLNSLGWTSLDFAGFIKSPKVEIEETEDEKGRIKRTEKVIEGEYTYSLRYDEFVAPLVKVVQAQKNVIQAQENVIQAQENKIASLEERIAAIEAKLTK